MYDVELTTSPVQVCVQYRTSVRVNHLSDDIGVRMDELYKAAFEAGLNPCGPPSIAYPDHPGSDGELTIELDVPVVVIPDHTAKVLSGSGMQLHAGGGEVQAYAIHRGAYHHLGTAHAALNEWLAANDHDAAGPHRERYLLGPGEADSPDDFVTEVSVPVAPS